ncbi:MAG TPA: glutamate--tRNA ligase [Bacteroidia bacterium]|jgi:glutamyl-tRNA synthetase|nr:glutamate--tRNA ligase [Bacteroidia bacterium]
MSERPVRVRFAPSPTGPLHIGGVRTALYNYLFAKKHNGTFILRIEDTDQNRFVPGAENYIVEALTWCGINIEEGIVEGGPYAPYRQSERKAMYRQYAEKMVEAGHAYYAFDTTEELDAMRKRLEAAKVAAPQYNAVTRSTMKNSLTLSEDEVKKRLESGEQYVIRVKIPRNEEVRFHDIIRGWVVVHTQSLDDKVLFKSDGMPTYHLANVVDDYLMKITHVIRGEEWLPSAPLHVLLYRFMGWEEVMPQFAHLPLLLRPDGNGKLSKRDGDRLGFPVFPLDWKDPATGEQSSGYRERGYFPDAVVNLLAFLGWNPGTTQELFTMDELIASFSLERVSKHGAKFDPDKAKWYNQQYLRKRNDIELAGLFMPIVKEKGIETTIDHLGKVCGLIKEKAHFVNEFWDLGSFFFVAPTKYDEGVIQKKWKDGAPAFFAKLKDVLANTSDFTAHNVEVVFKKTAEENNTPAGSVMQLFRVLITGLSAGPVLFDAIELLGKDEVVKRLDNALKEIK